MFETTTGWHTVSLVSAGYFIPKKHSQTTVKRRSLWDNESLWGSSNSSTLHRDIRGKGVHCAHHDFDKQISTRRKPNARNSSYENSSSLEFSDGLLTVKKHQTQRNMLKDIVPSKRRKFNDQSLEMDLYAMWGYKNIVFPSSGEATTTSTITQHTTLRA